MTDWYFCVTPDFVNKNGQFLPPNAPANTNQFWYDATNGAVYAGPDNPPPLAGNTPKKDKVAFAVEVTQNSGADDYSVDDITLVSTVSQSPVGAGAVPGTVGAPFRNGKHVVCHYSGAPNHNSLQITGRKYKRTSLHPVNSDNGPNLLSAYEIVLVSSVSDVSGSYEFSTDPEMDVSN